MRAEVSLPFFDNASNQLLILMAVSWNSYSSVNFG